MPLVVCACAVNTINREAIEARFYFDRACMMATEMATELKREDSSASGETPEVTTKLPDIDQEDSSLLDGALGEGDGEVEGDESALSLLDETGDGVQIEDPVCSGKHTQLLTSSHGLLQEIEAIKARVKEMEEEAEKLKEMQGEVEKQLMGSKPGARPRWEPAPYGRISPIPFQQASSTQLLRRSKMLTYDQCLSET